MSTPAPQPDTGLEAIWKLVGSQITSFGMNAAGEFYLTTNRGHEFVIGKDERDEVSLYEIEKVTHDVQS